MKIDPEKSILMHKITEELDKYNIQERLEIITQLNLKMWIIYVNDKNVCLQLVSDMYDILEENANASGII